MLGIKVKSAVKCHLFTSPQPLGEPAPAAEKNPKGNTVIQRDCMSALLCGWQSWQDKLLKNKYSQNVNCTGWRQTRTGSSGQNSDSGSHSYRK